MFGQRVLSLGSGKKKWHGKLPETIAAILWKNKCADCTVVERLFWLITYNVRIFWECIPNSWMFRTNHCLFLGLGWNSWLIMISLACWDRYIASRDSKSHKSQSIYNGFDQFWSWIWVMKHLESRYCNFLTNIYNVMDIYHLSSKLIMIIVIIIWITVLAPLHGKTYGFLLSHRSESLMTSPLLGWHLAWYQMLISWMSLHFGCFCIYCIEVILSPLLMAEYLSRGNIMYLLMYLQWFYTSRFEHKLTISENDDVYKEVS